MTNYVLVSGDILHILVSKKKKKKCVQENFEIFVYNSKEI
jgi:hypothetical protein